MSVTWVLLAVALLNTATDAFTLYPSMNATIFGDAMGINDDCLAALYVYPQSN